MAGEIAKALVGELVSIGTSFLIDTCHKYRNDVKEKLDRLEMLVSKLRSISEVSNLCEVESLENLRKWKEKLDEAAEQGDDVIRLFKERANREKSTEDSESGYSIASSSKNAAKRLKRWFSADDDVNNLNDTLKRLERTNDEVREFIDLVKIHQQYRLDFLARRRERKRRCECKRKHGAVVLGYVPRNESPLMIVIACWFGFILQIARWARVIPIVARRWYVYFSSKYGHSRGIRVEQLITQIHNRIQDVEQGQTEWRYLIITIWLTKMRQVISESEIELRFLKSRENGLKNSTIQHNHCLSRLLSRLEKAAKDTEDIGALILQILTIQNLGRCL